MKSQMPTFKKYCNAAFAVEAAFAVVCIVGWFLHLENPVGMMNCDTMAFIGTIAVYGGKSGFEHSQWATPLAAGIASGLSSGDPVAGVQNAINTYESQKQMEQMTEQADQPCDASPEGTVSQPIQDANHNMAG